MTPSSCSALPEHDAILNSTSLPLAHELRAQHQPLDGIVLAVNFSGLSVRRMERMTVPMLQGLACALNLEILDEHHAIAIGKKRAGDIAHF